MKTYAELLQLDDESLRREGWSRNEHGGLSRLNSQHGKKTFGLVGFVRGFLGGAAPPHIASARLQICRACHHSDSLGVRLYRRDGDAEYCGRPRLEQVMRDESADGCGCELKYKTSRAEAACPLGRWAKLSENDAPPLRLHDPDEPPPSVHPPQPSLDDAIDAGVTRPCGCGKSVSKERERR